MRAEIIEEAQGLRALEAEWAGLYERCGDVSPFQHPGWLLPWWEWFGSGRPFCIAFRESGRLEALAPMFLHSWRGRRQVTFLGNGVSDRLGLLAEPSAAGEAAAA